MGSVTFSLPEVVARVGEPLYCLPTEMTMKYWASNKTLVTKQAFS
jgi:hypothetical protein